MNVLGIHIRHDSSACLVVGRRIVADVAEERFTRTKHYAGLPINAIDYCLSEGSLIYPAPALYLWVLGKSGQSPSGT